MASAKVLAAQIFQAHKALLAVIFGIINDGKNPVCYPYILEDGAEVSLEEAIKRMFDTLPDSRKWKKENKAQLLILRFGLEDGRPMTREKIAPIFRVRRERIRQVEGKALRACRHPSRSKLIGQFLVPTIEHAQVFHSLQDENLELIARLAKLERRRAFAVEEKAKTKKEGELFTVLEEAASRYPTHPKLALRTFNALCRTGINSFPQLIEIMNRNERYVVHANGIGEKSLELIRKAVGISDEFFSRQGAL